MRITAHILGLICAGCLLAEAPSAWELYERGREAEKAGRMTEAYLDYSEASAIEPKNETYWFHSQAVRSRAELESRAAPQIRLDHPDADTAESPGQYFDPPTARDLMDARKPLPPTELAARAGKIDIDLRGDYKQLWEGTAQALGLDCIFDNDYQAGTPFRLQLRNVDYRDALHGLEAATGSFLVPISDKRFLVVKDTPQKRIELEPSVVVSVPLTEVTGTQEFAEMIRDVQQAMGIEKVAWDAGNSTVLMRDRISKVLPARALFEDLLHARAQVMVDLEMIEISRNDMITYGIDFQTLFSLTPLTKFLNNVPSLSQNLAGLLVFGGGKTLLGLGVVDPSLVAKMSTNSSKVLLSAQLRAMDGQAATLHVGDRYPILNSGYFGTVAAGANIAAPPPSFTFEDLGLQVKVTPKVHSLESVSLDVEAAYKVLTGAAENGIPVVANRSVKDVTRLKFGEWAMVAGLLDTSDARIVAGLAGLSRIPYVGPLTSTHERNRTNTQVLILMRPHLITLPPGESPSHTILVGTDSRPLTPL